MSQVQTNSISELDFVCPACSSEDPCNELLFDYCDYKHTGMCSTDDTLTCGCGWKGKLGEILDRAEQQPCPRCYGTGLVDKKELDNGMDSKAW